ncbi:MAG: DUF3592 domain-containing protein [Acidobacteriota bacterium]|nr:DUF3592 domain-containing protein [Acidobacteriota bacterium]
MKKFSTIFLVWLLLTCFSAFITSLLLGTAKYYKLSNAGITIPARVTAKEPDNHQFIRYAYIVNGQSYEGEGSAGYGNPSFNNINIGQQIMVVYDPTDPHKSCLGDPTPRFHQTLIGIAFVAILFPLFSVIGLYYKGFLHDN